MTKTMKWIGVVILAAGVTANAQGQAGGAGSNKQGGGQGNGGAGGPGGQHQRPTPEQMAKHLMEKFDANKDGELSLDELTQAVEALREHHPHGTGG